MTEKSAVWWVHEDDEDLHLQIELGQPGGYERAIVLSVSKTGEGQSIRLWSSNSSSSFINDGIAEPGWGEEQFREWLASIDRKRKG